MSTSRDAPSVVGSGAPTGAELYYRTQLGQGNFLIQRCGSCGRSIFYPRMICPFCGSDQLSWFAPSMLGTVYSTTVVRRAPEHGGDYNVALIDLAEGVRMMSRVVGMRADEVEIGMRVQGKVVDAEDGGLVIFEPLGTKS